MDGAVRVVRVVTGQGGQVGQVVGMLGSSSQHNVLSENKRVYDLRVLFIKYKRKCEITRLGQTDGAVRLVGASQVLVV